MRKRTLTAAVASALTGVLLTAAGSGAATASAPGPVASAAAASCKPSSLQLHTPGVLTVGTDAPAYPPYFENNQPANGKGFESAVAYAVGRQLGFGPKKVKWVVEPFDSSYAPGPKSFDFDINEISITPARANEVSFSSPYYENPQAIIVDSNSPYAHAKSLAAFKNATIGVQIGTTSLTAVQSLIDPSKQVQVFNDSDDVVSAFKIHRVDAIVVDYATALYLTSSEIKGTKIAGQFNAPGGDSWGMLMGKGSTLTPCVNKALAALKANGTLKALTKRWMSSSVKIPVLK